MIAAAATAKISLEEYFEREFNSETRNEFIDGQIRHIPYASENHRQIVHNLDLRLGICLNAKEEKVFTNDTLIYWWDCNKGYYPDVAVFPSDIEYRDYKGKMKAALNPTALIEVLSESTEHVDRGEKWKCYQQIPSLNQYILVSQDEMLVEVFTRYNGSDEWLNKHIRKEEQFLTIGDCRISLREIYQKVKFGNAASDESPQESLT